jgi:hypothetical protein
MFVILLVTSQFCFWVLSAISPGVYCCFRERSKGLKLVTLADCPLKKEKINASLETLPNNSYFHAIGPNWVTCPSLAARVWGGGIRSVSYFATTVKNGCRGVAEVPSPKFKPTKKGKKKKDTGEATVNVSF